SALKGLAEKWAGAKAAERANAQSYLIELCEALGLERPRPAGTGYEFELPIKVIARDGTEAQNFIDLYKERHFLLEAKDADGGKNTDLLLRRAFGQARTYAAHVPGGVAPPYLLVLDVGKTLLVWDRWSGSFGGYAAHVRRIDLPRLHQRPEDIALLIDIWSNPSARDPRSHAQAVTKEIAERLAQLAKSLEDRGLDQERVAKFLMRCVFAMFAEDVGLLPHEAFRQTIQNAGAKPEVLARALESLWKAMDEGGLFGYEKFLRFNGHFFREAEALPLTPPDIALLLEAAKADWQDVEPTIFGTLLVRALDPEERHRLGAEYTPRAFIERLVRPTVEEPIRERWTAVQGEVLQLRQSGKPKDRTTAATRLRDFHTWMRGLRFLDPACGSGNFLYVTMHLVKEIELEVINELADVTEAREFRLEEVDPSQFYGIEVKPWAREIAELVLWIGFHQHWKRHHHVQPPEPVLQDTGTLECRDAVLAWDRMVHRPARDRLDPKRRIAHTVTGELVPDPGARLPYLEHVGARPAPWPDADFIIGNPPYLGEKRQRDVLGDGYVDALRAAYEDVTDSADLVAYFWHRAASAVAGGRTLRAGLITTNSITQAKNRTVIESAAARGVGVAWAVADHVWYDGDDGAEVRVAMTVLALRPANARLVRVDPVERVRGEVAVIEEIRVPRLNADLTAHANVAGAADTPLLANAGLSYQGYKRGGDGFVLSADEARSMLIADPRHREVIHPYRNGKDLTSRPRDVYVIDLGLMTEDEAREYPILFDRLRDRVYPERVANPRASYARYWWRFLEPRRELREALHGLPRYLVTSEVSKHPIFAFADAGVAPDGTLVCIALADEYALGVLSSSIHAIWSFSAGGRMGVRHTPRYSKGICFDAFPFPSRGDPLRTAIADAAVRIERHRSAALGRDETVTLMKLYDVVSALRAGRALTPTQRHLHELGACGVLRDLHDDLDRLVAEAYGWSWPEPPSLVLERLVTLHDARVEEERAGHVRWLRPNYQKPRFGSDSGSGAPTAFELPESEDPERSDVVTPAPWPKDAVGQITVLRQIASEAPITVEAALKRFTGAKRELVERHLETLAILGEVQRLEDGRYAAFAMVS
ncbi:MAG TPA: hypothetical protein PKH96_14910, partial [Gemmatimonadaceae bacterium]|nr:hypothetical protein [Gemmatimonadaceae bacterium]